jgi:ubiquinone biosynthesis protein COQ4
MIQKVLYDTHRRLTPGQRVLVFVSNALRALKDPTRADAVGAVGETTGGPALRNLYYTMMADEDGRKVLAMKPRVNEDTVPLTRLKEFATETLGHQYYQYMASHGFSSDERPLVRFIDDAELAYIFQRYREVHDFWHVLLQQPPTVLGELTVKWSEWVHTRLPVCALSGIGSAVVLLNDAERKFLTREVVPWISEHVPKFTKNMMCIPYEDLLHRPVQEIRDMYNISTPPVFSDAGAQQYK